MFIILVEYTYILSCKQFVTLLEFFVLNIVQATQSMQRVIRSSTLPNPKASQEDA